MKNGVRNLSAPGPNKRDLSWTVMKVFISGSGNVSTGISKRTVGIKNYISSFDTDEDDAKEVIAGLTGALYPTGHPLKRGQLW